VRETCSSNELIKRGSSQITFIFCLFSCIEYMKNEMNETHSIHTEKRMYLPKILDKNLQRDIYDDRKILLHKMLNV
jgi:hypothetical protein